MADSSGKGGASKRSLTLGRKTKQSQNIVTKNVVASKPLAKGQQIQIPQTMKVK
jgi:hypothetical protein